MNYAWYYSDNDELITTGAGAHKITYAGRIGGGSGNVYNTRFTMTDVRGRAILGEYHIKFKIGSTQVDGIRFKTSSTDPKGNDICRVLRGSKTQSLGSLKNECKGYTNHEKLIAKFRDAIADATRLPNNELA